MSDAKPLLPDPSLAAEHLLAVFHETNDHMRNAEQKQLTITGLYLAVAAVTVSLMSEDKITILTARPESSIVYTFILVIGCCVYLLQAWCRVWKEHYLDIVNRIAATWALPTSLLPYWLRNNETVQRRFLFKPNVDNTLLYFTFALNTAMAFLLSMQMWALMLPDYRSVAIVGLVALYVTFLVFTYRLSQNRRNVLKA